MIYVALLLLSFSLTYFIKNYAIKKSLVAEVNERSSHTVPTPHGGGIAIAVTWFAGLTYLFFADKIESSLYCALMLGVLLSVVSYLDDLYELSARLRLITQAGVALGGIWALGGLHHLDFGIFSIDNRVLTNIFAFFMIIWFINLYNFLDGINGYAGAEALFLAVAGFLLFGGDYFLVLSVSVLGFLFWNWNKAKIFMGDVGSTLLGYSIAVFTIYDANLDAKNLWVWIILFGVYWFDATWTLVRRKLNGERLSQAHNKHAYQRLVQSGWSHAKVVTYAMVLNALLLAVIVLVPNIFLAFLIMLIILFAVIKFVDRQKGFS